MPESSGSVSRFAQIANSLGEVAGAIAGALILAAGISKALELASRLHWIVGAVFAAVIATIAVWLIHLVKHSQRGADLKGLLAVLVLGLMSFAVVCAWISFTLHTTGASVYMVPDRYSPGTFVDFYMYTLLDVLPGLDTIDTLHVKLPIQSRDFVGGLPVLLFKVFVVFYFVEAIVSWRKRVSVKDAAPEPSVSSQP